MNINPTYQSPSSHFCSEVTGSCVVNSSRFDPHLFKARGKMGALVSLYLLNVVPSDGDCIGYSSHWCGKLSDSSLREKGLGLGLQFREDTVHRGGEGMVAGTGGSWSHHIGSQEAGRVNRGEARL